MGTNYFLRTPGCANACEHCALDPDLHIGKSSAGWAFGFRGYRVSPCDGVPPIRSWKDWRRTLAAHPAWRIVDEYGEEQDRASFTTMVESSDPAIRGRQAQLGIDEARRWSRDPDDWIDGEGFSFYDGWFS